MSKSYNNPIEVSDPPEVIREKVRQMVTDRTRIRRTDPGHPEACGVCQMHRLFVPPAVQNASNEDCRQPASRVDRKAALAEALIEYTRPFTERLNYYREHEDEVREVLLAGSRRARDEAVRTMSEVRSARGLIGRGKKITNQKSKIKRQKPKSKKAKMTKASSFSLNSYLFIFAFAFCLLIFLLLPSDHAPR